MQRKSDAEVNQDLPKSGNFSGRDCLFLRYSCALFQFLGSDSVVQLISNLCQDLLMDYIV